MPFEYDLEDKEELENWKDSSGYLICWHFGHSLLTVLRKSVFEDDGTWEEFGVPPEKFWRIRFSLDRGRFYLRILSAELTYIFPMWLANALRKK